MLTAKEFNEKFNDRNRFDWTKVNDVLGIIKSVQTEGDAALDRFTKQFDGPDAEVREVPAGELKSAFDALEPGLKAALTQAKKNIEAYQRKIKWPEPEADGLHPVLHPIRRTGIYVPGGKASYPSTVLMTAVPARVAGVEEITVVTPPPVNPSTLAACYMCGVDHVYTVGGAQAIAALAYGTDMIRRVDKIVGPGNQFVALAKKLVYGDVGIDSIAGPSELAVVVDSTANAEWAAYDLLAQAEHDEMARTFLVSEDREKLEEVSRLASALAEEAPRADIIKESLRTNHYAVLCENRDEIIQVLDRIAPEHLSVQTADAETYARDVRNAGALFVGGFSPEALGDYSAGPSHVLPTSGNARFQSGLSVNDFLKTNAVIRVTEESYPALASAALPIAKSEQLHAHAASIEVRLGKRGNE
ncbi:histidinol dehydrogenase [Indiicoccus explosivorum]|uniref:histidinol dehydrogenase n=1 Tax=Indiicoccus explosivorum TaxID=1917864 RepID=UPI000B43D573|nr:histidinol dehydrogenase [Indiicoccus explosivorum]